MTMQELLAAEYATQKQYALVFSQNLSDVLADGWAAFGPAGSAIDPILLNNGKRMLCADVLSEVREGGMFARIWQNINVEAIIAGTQVISWGEGLALRKIDHPENVEA